MEEIQPTLPLERNPVTYRRHRREVFWQITIPIVVGSIIILVLAILATQTTGDRASNWADISMIWLIAPIMMITLLSLAFLIASIYLNVRLLQVLPFYSRRVQDWFLMLTIQVSRLGNKAVAPVLRIQGLSASIGTLGRNIRRK